MSGTENWTPCFSWHWSALWVQSCHAALPAGFCLEGRAVIPCLPSAGSEQLQPRGHRRLQEAGSQRALGGRGLHHHRPRHHRHLLRGSLHYGEQGLSQPGSTAAPPLLPLLIYLGMHGCFPKAFFHIFNFIYCLWLNTSDSVLAAVGFLETLAAPICFSLFGQLLFGFSPPQLHHLSDQATWDL